MPTYEIRAPNGKTYRIDGPAGATDAQVRAEVLRQFPDAGSAQSKFSASASGTAKTTGPKKLQRPTLTTVAKQSALGTLGGIAEGLMSPLDLAARGGNLVERGLGMGVAAIGEPVARGLGLDSASKFFNRMGEDASAGEGNYKPITSSTFIERALPDVKTSNVRFASNMLGGAMVPVPSLPRAPTVRFPGTSAPVKSGKLAETMGAKSPKVIEGANDVIAAGNREGVRVMTSDVRPPRTFLGKAAQAIGERIPYAGTGGSRAAQQEQRAGAVRNVLRDHGADDASLALVDDVAADLSATRGAELSRLTGAKDRVIDKFTAAVDAPNAIAEIDRQIARLQGINADAYAPVVAKLENFKGVLSSGKTLRQVEGNRKLLGDLFADPNLASIKGEGQKAINAIYGPLRDDMGAFIKARGAADDFANWKTSNDKLAAMAGELSNAAFRNVLKNAEATPEAVANLLFSKKPSDVARLYANLSPQGQAKAQGAILQRALEKAGDLENLSPDKFVNEMNRLAKNVGVVFKGADLERVQGFGKLLDATKRAAQASVAPPTGVQAVPYAMGAGFTALFGAAKGIGMAGATGLIARAYESAPVRNALVKLARAKHGTKAEEIALQGALAAINDNMATLAKGAVGAASHGDGAILNTNIPVRASAGEAPEERNRQQQVPQP